MGVVVLAARRAAAFVIGRSDAAFSAGRADKSCCQEQQREQV